MLEGKKVNRVSGNNDGTYWHIFDIKLFSRDKFQVLMVLEDKIALGIKKYWIATVNPEFVMEAQKDKKFKEILGKTSINVIDGIGLVWARELDHRLSIINRRNLIKKITIGTKVGLEILRGNYENEVTSGASLISDLVEIAAKDDKKVFFLGGWGDRAERTAKYFETKNLDHRLSTVDRRYKLKTDWSAGEPDITNEEVIKKINKFKPDILLVAYGMKKQEFWIANNIHKLEVGIVMGVGRSFDYYSGELKRAPNLVRKMGMEWFYSLVKEPKRLKRQLVLPKFWWKVLNS